MKSSRFFTFLLVVILWISTSGFAQGSQLHATTAGRASADLPVQLEDLTFGKTYPTNGADNVPAVSVTLEWEALEGVDGVTYFYCVAAANKQKCPPGQWKRAGSNTTATVTNLIPDKAYRWWVNVYTGTKIFLKDPIAVADGGYWTFTTKNLPGSFGKVAPANLSSGLPPSGLLLSWGTSTNAESFEYCVDTSDNSLCDTAWVNVGTALSAAVPTLYNNSIYYWQVRAVNASGYTYANSAAWWQFSTEVVTDLFVKLGPIDGATGQLINGLVLSWSSSAGAVGYHYCLKEINEPCVDAEWLVPSTSTATILNGLAYETTYYWQVKADYTVEDALADEGQMWSFTTQYPPPAAFDKVSPGDTETEVSVNPTLSWEPSGGTGISYEYCIDTTSNSQFCLDGWTSVGSALSDIAYGMDPSETYYWQVRATNSTGTTVSNGGLWSFTTEAAPGTFGKSSPTSGTGLTTLSPTLTWTPSSGTNITYQVCIYPSGGSQCAEAEWSAPATTTSFTPTGLAYGTTYNWQVRAENSVDFVYADGVTWWSFTTPPAPPADFSKSAPVDTTTGVPLAQTLTWDESQTGVSFEYCLDTTDDDECSDAAGGGTGWVSASSGAAPDLEFDTTYFWQVKAVNVSGEVQANGGAWWSFHTLLDPSIWPDDFSKTAPADTATGVSLTPTLSWQSSSAGSTYEYCVTENLSEGCTGPWTSAASSTSVDLSAALKSNTLYYWQVRARGSNSNLTEADDEDSQPWWSFETQNKAPAISLVPTIVVRSGEQVRFFAAANDLDMPNDTLTFSIVGLPAGATFDTDTGEFVWTPAWSPAGPNLYQMTVTVTDSDNLTDSAEVSIQVDPQSIFLPIVIR